MADISEIVSVSVSIESATIDTASFSVPLFISTHNVFTDRYQIYTSESDAVTDGFTSDHPVYLFLSNVFAGSQAPTQVIVGRKALESLTFTVDEANDDTTYGFTVVVGDTSSTISISSGTSATVGSIATLLATELDSVSGITYSDDEAGNVEVTPDDMDSEFYIKSLTDDVSLTYNEDTTEDYATAYAAIDTACSTDWFFISADTHLDDDILAMATIASSNDDLYVVTSTDSGIIASDTDDIGSQLSDLSRQNTMLMYHSEADDYYPEGAIIGNWAATNPGTVTLHGQELDGVSVDSLTSTQIANAQGKNVSTYVSIAGDGFLLDGFVSDGEFADTIRFVLWLEARVAEELFSLIKRKASAGSKVPMDSRGFLMCRQAIASVLELAYSRGATTLDDYGQKYTISIPERSDISDTNRAARLLPDVSFSLIYSGAIHRVKTVSGTVEI